MNKQELKDRFTEVRDAYFREYREIARAYADEHCPVKVGDIVRSHNGWIRVEEIHYSCDSPICSNYTPSCFFTGPRVTRQGVPYKNGATDAVYPWSVSEVNGVKTKYIV